MPVAAAARVDYTLGVMPRPNASEGPVPSPPSAPLSASEGSAPFRHFLWRKQPQERVLEGFYPEVLSTNGAHVRRLVSMHKQIVFQSFEDLATSRGIIERIESSVTPGITLVGYSMFKHYDSLAILQTGKPEEPGWMAFPYTRGQHRQGGEPTMPLRALATIPKLRLVAGLGLYWRKRQLIIHGALEQRGSEQAAQASDVDLLSQLSSVELHTVEYRQGLPRRVEIATSPHPIDGLQRISPSRVEASFALEPSIYRELRRGDFQVWLILRFKRDLLCLPPEWSAFWLLVDLHEPPDLMF